MFSDVMSGARDVRPGPADVLATCGGRHRGGLEARPARAQHAAHSGDCQGAHRAWGTPGIQKPESCPNLAQLTGLLKNVYVRPVARSASAAARSSGSSRSPHSTWSSVLPPTHATGQPAPPRQPRRTASPPARQHRHAGKQPRRGLEPLDGITDDDSFRATGWSLPVLTVTKSRPRGSIRPSGPLASANRLQWGW